MTFQIKSGERLSGGISDMFSDRKSDKDKSNAQTNSVKSRSFVEQPSKEANTTENADQSMRFKHYEERVRRMKNIKR